MRAWPPESSTRPCRLRVLRSPACLPLCAPLPAPQAMWGGSGGNAGSCACDLPANNNAYRLPLSQAAVTGGTWNWAVEEMPEGRNMVDNVSPPCTPSKSSSPVMRYLLGSCAPQQARCFQPNPRSDRRSVGCPPHEPPLSLPPTRSCFPAAKCCSLTAPRYGFTWGTGLQRHRSKHLGSSHHPGFALHRAAAHRSQAAAARKTTFAPFLPQPLQFGNSNGGGPFGGGQARDPSYSAWLYNPYAPAGARFKVMATSPIKRLYHSVAMLLPHGSVLVAGSEQGERPCTGSQPGGRVGLLWLFAAVVLMVSLSWQKTACIVHRCGQLANGRGLPPAETWYVHGLRSNQSAMPAPSPPFMS
jgi:hypothetical protein